MAIMKVKDENGVWHDVPALVGPAGPAGKDGKDGAQINDTTPSTKTTYSSSKIEALLDEQKEAIDDLLPDVASADAGKFLRVSSGGAWVAESIASAEGANF